MKKYPKFKRPKAWLETIDELLEAYENSKIIEECPLCVLAEVIDEFNESDDDYRDREYCVFCPWVLFEKKECTDPPGYKKFTVSEKLKRLRRWKRIINKQIK